MTTITPGKLNGLRRLADSSGRFKMLAVDQRPPLETLVKSRIRPEGDPFREVARIKATLVEELAAASTAVLMDPQYIFPAGLPLVPHGKGILLTLEDDRFEETTGGRLSRRIPNWSVAKIRSAGGDGVKVLAWYRPDAAPQVREHQQRFVAEIGRECARHDIPFVLELLLYALPGEDGHTSDYREQPNKRVEHVIESVSTFSQPDYRVDLFKLESPLPAETLAETEQRDPDLIATAFRDLGRTAARPWVLLSAGARPQSFERALRHAYSAGASGYLAGRAIWWEACEHYPDWKTMARTLREEAISYMRKINRLTDQLALPWDNHPAYGDEGPRPPQAGDTFRSSYGEAP